MKSNLLLLLTATLLADGFPIRAAERPAPAVPIPPAGEILARVKKEHPRLLMSSAEFAALKQRVATNTTLRQWHSDLRQESDKILRAAPSKYEIPDGLRLLATSRRVLGRVETLALIHRLNGGQQYVDRAWLELSTAAAFTNWNPRHFLDTAEMTHAFAIGYDWLYDQWTPEQRKVLREAMVEKGIKLANEIHSKNTWWARASHNWNQVCNGGIGMGALALADEEPAVCGQFLESALKSIQLAMAEFAPDGAWAEGPGYWSYATSYNCSFLAGLDSALGTDFGLAQLPGFSLAGMFPIFASGPTGKSFDYADAHAGVIRAPQLFWFARKFNQPAYAVFERRNASPGPLDLVWYDPRGEGAMPADLPLDTYFRNSEIVLLRSAWSDPQALWVGFKAGDNKANHSNLDLGGFVFEALGQRWAVELGADDYNMAGYFGSQRWTYYRMRAEGHNTLVINPGKDPDQDPKAAAKILRFGSSPQNSFAIADLTAAYTKDAVQARRGIAMLDRRQILVQDEIETRKPSEVWWFLHTPAKVTLSADGHTATLALGGETLRVQIMAPAYGKFTVLDATPLPGLPNPAVQNKNRGIRKLALRLDGVAKERIAVLLQPGTAAATAPKLTALSDWRTE